MGPRGVEPLTPSCHAVTKNTHEIDITNNAIIKNWTLILACQKVYQDL